MPDALSFSIAIISSRLPGTAVILVMSPYIPPPASEPAETGIAAVTARYFRNFRRRVILVSIEDKNLWCVDRIFHSPLVKAFSFQSRCGEPDSNLRR